MISPLSGADSAEPAKVAEESAVLYARPFGHFEIITAKPDLGPWALEMGDMVWRQLAQVIPLPKSGFSTPIAVRLIPVERWESTEPSLVRIETAGRVTVQMSADDASDGRAMLQALVRGLLVKRASVNTNYGFTETVPLWLELAATQWVLVRTQPSLHDQWCQESAGLRLPPMLTVLSWPRDRPQPPHFSDVAYGALLWLQGMGEANGQWVEFLRRQLAGVPATQSLEAFLGQPWPSTADLDLAWQVGFTELRRQHPVPQLSIGESGDLLRSWSRVILYDTEQGRDVLVLPDVLWKHRRESIVRGLATIRTGEIEVRLGVLHPFYVNAANSLGHYFLLIRQGKSQSTCAAAWQQFERDWSDAEELREVSTAVLDRAQAARPAAR